MKKPLYELRKERDELMDEANTMNAQHPGSSPMPKAEANRLDTILAKIDAIDREFTNREKETHEPGGGWRDESGSDIKVMRTPADFRAHYASAHRGPVNMPGEDPVRIDDLLRGIAGMNTTQSVRNALSVGTDTSGGYSVPSIVMPQILEALVPASSLLRAGAGIVPLMDGAKTYTTAAINTIPAAAWRNEGAAVAESDPTFRAVVAKPQSLSFYFKMSRELLADAPNIASAATTAIAQAFAVELDRAGLRGSGTAPEPLGLLNTVGIQSVANGANGAVLSGYANLLAATKAILQANAPMPTAAIMSPRSLVELAGLVDTLGQPIEKPQMLENWQLIGTSQVPNNLTVGTSADCSEIYVGDFTNLKFMMRELMSIQVLHERFADTGQIAFLCHVRADVAVLYPSAFAVVTGVR